MAANKLNILIDADALVALIKKDDSNHKRAVSILHKIEDNLILTTPYTIPETVTVISHKMTQREAKESLVDLRNKNFTEIPTDFDIVQKADEIFIAQNAKKTSWIDCLNVAVVKIKKLDGIFSFDKFYQKLGLKTF